MRIRGKQVKLANDDQAASEAASAAAAAVVANLPVAVVGDSGLTVSEVAAKIEPDVFDRLLAEIKPHDGELRALFGEQAGKASAAYTEAGEQFAKFFGQIVENNPGGDVAELLARGDVQTSLDRLLGGAFTKSEDAVKAGHFTGASLGAVHAADEAKVYGIVATQPVIAETSPTTEKILGDLTRNSDGARADLATSITSAFDSVGAATDAEAEAAVEGGSINVGADLATQRGVSVIDAIEQAFNNLALRAGLSASTATSSAYNDQKLATLDATGTANPLLTIQKVWVTTFIPTTCGECAALHGTVLGTYDEFSSEVTFESGDADPSYDGLDAPPRHPNCGCEVVLYIAGVSPEMDDAVSAMKQTAVDFAVDTDGLSPTADNAPTDIPAPSAAPVEASLTIPGMVTPVTKTDIDSAIALLAADSGVTIKQLLIKASNPLARDPNYHRHAAGKLTTKEGYVAYLQSLSSGLDTSVG